MEQEYDLYIKSAPIIHWIVTKLLMLGKKRNGINLMSKVQPGVNRGSWAGKFDNSKIRKVLNYPRKSFQYSKVIFINILVY